MADSGEERAQSGQLLRLVEGVARARELLLGALAVGDVDVDAGDQDRLAVRIADHGSERMHPAGVAVRPDHPMLERDGVVGKAASGGLHHHVPIVRMDEGLERRPVEMHFAVDPVERARTGAVPGLAGPRVDRPQAEIGALDRKLELPPGLGQLGLAALAVGDVEVDPGHHRHRPRRIALGLAEGVEPADLPGRPDHPMLERHRLFREAFPIGLANALPIVRMDIVLQGGGIDRHVGIHSPQPARPLRMPDRAGLRIDRPQAEPGALDGEVERPPGLVALLLGALAIGDVEMDSADASGDPVRIAVEGAQRIDPAGRAVGADDPIFDLDPILGEAVEIGLRNLFPMVGMDGRPDDVGAHLGIRRKAVHRLGTVGIPGPAGLGVEGPGAELRALDGELEAAARFGQLVIGAARRQGARAQQEAALAADGERGDADLERDHLAALHPEVDDDPQPDGGVAVGDIGVERVLILLARRIAVDQAPDRLADHLGLGIAVGLLGGAVIFEDVAFFVEQQKAVQRRADHACNDAGNLAPVHPRHPPGFDQRRLYSRPRHMQKPPFCNN